MNYTKQIEMIKRIDALIKRKATGTPDQLAKKLSVSRATTFRYLNNLKKMGAKIAYSKINNSYYYQEQFILTL